MQIKKICFPCKFLIIDPFRYFFCKINRRNIIISSYIIMINDLLRNNSFRIVSDFVGINKIHKNNIHFWIGCSGLPYNTFHCTHLRFIRISIGTVINCSFHKKKIYFPFGKDIMI